MEFYYGHFQVSSIEIERICNRVNDAILETAAIGVPPIGGGPEQLIIAAVLKDQSSQVEDLNQLKLAFNVALKKLNPLFKVRPLFLRFCRRLHPKFYVANHRGTSLNSLCFPLYAGFFCCRGSITPKNRLEQGHEESPAQGILPSTTGEEVKNLDRIYFLQMYYLKKGLYSKLCISILRPFITQLIIYL
jgi:hypothetical protein